MARRKAQAIDVPATLDEARALAAAYVTAERRIVEARLVAEQVIDQVKSERDALIALVSADQPGRFASLKAWWEAGGGEIAGKGRSAELAGAKIGIRRTTPKVKFRRGTKVETVVSWLGRVVGGADFLRTKIELDKEAVIKAMRSEGPMAEPLTEQGVFVDQTDEFFIDADLEAQVIVKEIGN